MQEVLLRPASAASLAGARSEGHSLVQWFKNQARPFLQANAPEVLPPLDNDVERLERVLARPERVTVCFLGHSGVGKSTLLNALAGGKDHVLPAGGMGPLTALATEVSYREKPWFRASYHKRSLLWRVGFALEQAAKRPGQANESGGSFYELDAEQRAEVETEISAGSSEAGGQNSPITSYRKQAQQIVTGDQFGERALGYLVNALRFACGYESPSDILPDDRARLERVQQALALAERDAHFEIEADGQARFATELKAHTTGFLAPIIRKIHVGWPSSLLKAGLDLVDLPGVGVAGDAYRSATQAYIRGAARAVILTVDRAGLTSETIELLRNSGYWDRLVGAVDDPSSDPCSLFVAITKVDDVSSEEWRNLPPEGRPKRRDFFANTRAAFKSRMRSQIADQLSSIGVSTNAELVSSRTKARETILQDLQVHPVSAPEYRKILLDDDDDQPFLRDDAETGIPELSIALAKIAEAELAKLESDLVEVSERLREAASSELRRLETLWRTRAREKEIEEALKRELDLFISEKRVERDSRRGAFREFLDSTAKDRIKLLVSEAREIAEDEVREYLRDLQGAHWATLKAAVTRGGSYFGKRQINIPDDVATRFQEPMASIWSTKLLVDVRKRTGEFASDHIAMVEELCDWARDKTHSNSQSDLIEEERKRIKRLAEQMKQVGKEAVGELRETVKTKISESIKKPIRRACDEFVAKGGHSGPGTKQRILELFGDLARQSTKAAQAPATKILEGKFDVVRSEIKNVYEQWGDPLERTAGVILQQNSHEIEHRSEAEREETLTTIKQLLEAGVVKAAEPAQAHG